MGMCGSNDEEEVNNINLLCLQSVGITANTLYSALQKKEEVDEKLELLLTVLKVLNEKKLLESAKICDFSPGSIGFIWEKEGGASMYVFISDKKTQVKWYRTKGQFGIGQTNFLEKSPEFRSFFQGHLERAMTKYTEV